MNPPYSGKFSPELGNLQVLIAAFLKNDHATNVEFQDIRSRIYYVLTLYWHYFSLQISEKIQTEVPGFEHRISDDDFKKATKLRDEATELKNRADDLARDLGHSPRAYASNVDWSSRYTSILSLAFEFEQLDKMYKAFLETTIDLNSKQFKEDGYSCVARTLAGEERVIDIPCLTEISEVYSDKQGNWLNYWDKKTSTGTTTLYFKYIGGGKYERWTHEDWLAPHQRERLGIGGHKQASIFPTYYLKDGCVCVTASNYRVPFSYCMTDAHRSKYSTNDGSGRQLWESNTGIKCAIPMFSDPQDGFGAVIYGGSMTYGAPTTTVTVTTVRPCVHQFDIWGNHLGCR